VYFYIIPSWFESFKFLFTIPCGIWPVPVLILCNYVCGLPSLVLVAFDSKVPVLSKSLFYDLPDSSVLKKLF
jgi:hypothetical protein